MKINMTITQEQAVKALKALDEIEDQVDNYWHSGASDQYESLEAADKAFHRIRAILDEVFQRKRPKSWLE